MITSHILVQRSFMVSRKVKFYNILKIITCMCFHSHNGYVLLYISMKFCMVIAWLLGCRHMKIASESAVYTSRVIKEGSEASASSSVGKFRSATYLWIYDRNLAVILFKDNIPGALLDGQDPSVICNGTETLVKMYKCQSVRA